VAATNYPGWNGFREYHLVAADVVFGASFPFLFMEVTRRMQGRAVVRKWAPVLSVCDVVGGISPYTSRNSLSRPSPRVLRTSSPAPTAVGLPPVAGSSPRPSTFH